MNHPLQAQAWTLLDRVQISKHWSIDLQVTESEISRWRSGSRAMSLDDLVAAIRVCRRLGHELVGLRVALLLVSEAQPGAADAPPPELLDTVLSLAELSGRGSKAVREVLADGHVSAEEAPAIDDLANLCEDLATRFRAIAAHARRIA